MEGVFRAQRVVALLVGFALLSLTPGLARAEKLLRWKFSKGDQRYIERHEQATIAINPLGRKIKLSQTLVIGQLVEDVNDQGIASITQKIERIQSSMDGAPGISFSYDSKSPAAAKGGAQRIAPLFDALLKAQFTVQVSPQGHVEEVVIPEDLAVFAEQAREFPVLGELYSKEGMTRMLKQNAAPFPELPVEQGDQWTDKDEVKEPTIGTRVITTSYSYDGEDEIDGRKFDKLNTSIKIEFVPGDEGQSPVSVTGQESSGLLLFDAENGQIVKGESTQHITMESMSQGQKIGTDIITKTDIKVTSEAP